MLYVRLWDPCASILSSKPESVANEHKAQIYAFDLDVFYLQSFQGIPSILFWCNPLYKNTSAGLSGLTQLDIN